MSSVFFPQLASGTMSQYPINKTRRMRTVRNVLRDGRLISFPDAGYKTLDWTLDFSGISQTDATALKALFDACAGPLQPFTFLDPVGNLFSWSSDLGNPVWLKTSALKITANVPGPTGQPNAFTITNNGQAFEDLIQTLQIPANYQYCLSISIATAQADVVKLVRLSPTGQDVTTVAIGAEWSRVSSSGRLNAAGSTFSAGIRLAPGQSVTVYGPQLEPQLAMSSYRSTEDEGSIYPDCFWASEYFALTADAPNSYSTSIHLQTRA